MSTTTETHHRWQWAGRLALLTCVLLGSWLLLQEEPRQREHSEAAFVPSSTTLASSVSSDAGHSAAHPATTQPIEEIRVGDRVHAKNPEVSDEERATWAEPNWDDWLHLSLVMPKEDGSELNIELLRPEAWFRERVSYLIEEPVEGIETMDVGAGDDVGEADAKNDPAGDSYVGTPLHPIYQDLAFAAENLESLGLKLVRMTVELDLPEMGASGTAVIIDVKPCVGVKHGKGKPVTATFLHPPSTEVLNVVFEGEDEPIGVTDNHLFWSVDRQRFLPIGKMEIGEQVQTFHGDTKRIEAKLPRPGPKVVYNLEVHGEHVYFVGEQGLLAHNMYPNRPEPPIKHSDTKQDRLSFGDWFTQKQRRRELRRARRPTPEELHHDKHLNAATNTQARELSLAHPPEASYLPELVKSVPQLEKKAAFAAQRSGKVVDHGGARFYFHRFDEPVGFNGGKKVHWVRVEVTKNPVPTIHSHPTTFSYVKSKIPGILDE